MFRNALLCSESFLPWWVSYSPPMLSWRSLLRLKKPSGDSAGAVLDAASQALQELSEWTTEALEQTLRRVIVEGMELSPRHAFGPLRVAVSGQRVSPPLFESMEVLGREHTLARLRSLRASL
jgi:glutamyl/glutaminyl-tRNA synthetase